MPAPEPTVRKSVCVWTRRPCADARRHADWLASTARAPIWRSSRSARAHSPPFSQAEMAAEKVTVLGRTPAYEEEGEEEEYEEGEG